MKINNWILSQEITISFIKKSEKIIRCRLSYKLFYHLNSKGKIFDRKILLCAFWKLFKRCIKIGRPMLERIAIYDLYWDMLLYWKIEKLKSTTLRRTLVHKSHCMSHAVSFWTNHSDLKWFHHSSKNSMLSPSYTSSPVYKIRVLFLVGCIVQITNDWSVVSVR